MTTPDDIRVWAEAGKSLGATHTLIVCDTWSQEDYPIHIMPDQDVTKEYERVLKEPFSKIMEVYNHSIDLDSQLGEFRVYNL